MMEYDVIIIGAGLGGLTAGAVISSKGYKVMLVEQHNVPGGCATTFKRKDLKIEVGLHMIDGLDEMDRKMELFKELGVFDKVEFIKAPEFYRYKKGDLDIVLPDNQSDATDALIKYFPEEEEGIRKYFKVMTELRKEIRKLPAKPWHMLLMIPLFPLLFPILTRYMNSTVGMFLDSLFSDEDLKLVLLGNLGYYHDDPQTASLIFFLGAQGSYLGGGGHFVKGGSQELSNHLASVIEDNGGTILYSHLVKEIIIEDGKATGISYIKKNADGDEPLVSKARIIIANAAVPNVANELIRDETARKKLQSSIKDLKIGPAILSLYLGFKKPLKELGSRYYSNVLIDSELTNQKDYLEYAYADMHKRSLIFVDYDQLDSGLAPEGKSVGVVTALDQISDWEGLTRSEYNKKKEEVARILIDRLDKLLPGIREEITYYELGTALTVRRYTLNPNGTAYGYAQIPGQAINKRLKSKSPVANLYFASAWSEPGHGFSGVIMGGKLCADKILKQL